MPAPKDPEKCALWKKRVGLASKERLKDKTKHPMYGKHPSPETLDKMRESHKGQVPWHKGKTDVYSPERIEELRIEGIERMKDPKRREDQRDILKKQWTDPEFQRIREESAREQMTNQWKDPEFRLKMKQELAKISKQKWKDPEYREKMLKATFASNHIKPNKAELRLFSILEKHFSGDYAINVKAEIMLLGGKIPDFVNVNGAKSCIELFGDYWHKGQDPQDRIDYFKQFGYNTLVVWEHELNDEDLLVQRLTRFKYVRRKKSHCQKLNNRG